MAVQLEVWSVLCLILLAVRTVVGQWLWRLVDRGLWSGSGVRSARRVQLFIRNRASVLVWSVGGQILGSHTRGVLKFGSEEISRTNNEKKRSVVKSEFTKNNNLKKKSRSFHHRTLLLQTNERFMLKVSIQMLCNIYYYYYEVYIKVEHRLLTLCPGTWNC